MHIKSITAVLLSITLVAGLSGCATEEQREAKLQSQAKVTRAEAERLALAQVPGGTIKEGELEKEKGKLIWSFDIATPGKSEITEIHLDALTGQLAGREIESATKEAKEKN
jgi:uncharacterized membrane protein YkoI